MPLIKAISRMTLGWMLYSLPVAAADFTVSNNGFQDYVINGLNDPTINLVRGRTYTFSISASGHPFWIKTSPVTGTGSAYNSGVTGNGTQVGTLTFQVPVNAPNTLYYICQFHSGMWGTISITDPPAQPATLANARFAQDGSFQFEVTGVPGGTYSIEATTNAITGWVSIGSTNAPSSGSFTFADTDVTSFSNKLYRVVTE